MEKLKKEPFKLPKLKELPGWRVSSQSPKMALGPQILSPFTVKSKKELNTSPRYPRTIKLPPLNSPKVANKPEDPQEHILEGKLYEIRLPETYIDPTVFPYSRRSHSSFAPSHAENNDVQILDLQISKRSSAALLIPDVQSRRNSALRGLVSSTNGRKELIEEGFKDAEIEANGEEQNFLGIGIKDEAEEGPNLNNMSLVVRYPVNEVGNETVRVLGENLDQLYLEKINYDLVKGFEKRGNESRISQNLVLEQKMRMIENSIKEGWRKIENTLPCGKRTESCSYESESKGDISDVEVFGRKRLSEGFDEKRCKSEICVFNFDSDREENEFFEEEMLSKYSLKYINEKKQVRNSDSSGVENDNVEQDESFFIENRKIGLNHFEKAEKPNFAMMKSTENSFSHLGNTGTIKLPKKNETKVRDEIKKETLTLNREKESHTEEKILQTLKHRKIEVSDKPDQKKRIGTLRTLTNSKRPQRLSKNPAGTIKSPTNQPPKPTVSKKNTKRSPRNTKIGRPSKAEKMVLYSLKNGEVQITLSKDSKPTENKKIPSKIEINSPKPATLNKLQPENSSATSLRSLKQNTDFKPRINRLKNKKLAIKTSKKYFGINVLSSVSKDPVDSFIQNFSVALLVDLRKYSKSIRKKTVNSKTPKIRSNDTKSPIEKSFTSQSRDSSLPKYSAIDTRDNLLSNYPINIIVKSPEKSYSFTSETNQDKSVLSKASALSKYKSGDKHYIKKLEISLKSKNSTFSLNKHEESENSSSFSYENSESSEQYSDSSFSDSSEDSSSSFGIEDRIRSNALYEVENLELVKNMAKSIFQSHILKESNYDSQDKNNLDKLASVAEIDESRSRELELPLNDINLGELEIFYTPNENLIFFRDEKMDLLNRNNLESWENSKNEEEMELRIRAEDKKKFLKDFEHKGPEFRVAEYARLQIIKPEEFITETLNLTKNPRLLEIDEFLGKKKKTNLLVK